ncbi:hypothetical protein C7476_101344 [Phyllobacterium bourgognense]|uniref:Uncharacterized protein n=1 Tax=Phyllobacterium bourgognense TaxID=314236 RepID=A0A368Z723_9HYPH|nr:hypothetical protein C7476_101344 [Phyllobacterium bourgognense]
MGTSASANCSNCGYSTHLTLGGGMLNHMTFAAWPVRCAKCEAITTANYKNAPLVCEQCSSAEVLAISDPANWSGDGRPLENWGKLVLTDGHYRCPKCETLELRFKHGNFNWD